MTQKYATFLIDPPWNETGGGKIKRGADKHYPLLKTKQIVPTIMSSGLFNPEDNAHLYLWTTSNFLPDALKVMLDLGFEYKTNIIWAKKKIGIGRYFRGKHEQILFGTRGRGWDVRTDLNNIPSLIEADHVRLNGKIVHSAKPDAFYELIENRSYGPYVEFFARRNRKNWTAWGNELKSPP